MNVSKLKGKIVENNMNVETVAEKIGMDRATFYRKLANYGDNFTIREATEVSKVLKLTHGDVMAIFFDKYVA